MSSLTYMFVIYVHQIWILQYYMSNTSIKLYCLKIIYKWTALNHNSKRINFKWHSTKTPIHRSNHPSLPRLLSISPKTPSRHRYCEWTQNIWRSTSHWILKPHSNHTLISHQILCSYFGSTINRQATQHTKHANSNYTPSMFRIWPSAYIRYILRCPRTDAFPQPLTLGTYSSYKQKWQHENIIILSPNHMYLKSRTRFGFMRRGQAIYEPLLNHFRRGLARVVWCTKMWSDRVICAIAKLIKTR